VYADRLIALDGSVTTSRYAGTESVPVLGTDRVRSVVYTGSSREPLHPRGCYVMGQHTVDLVNGRMWEAQPQEIDAVWVGVDKSGFGWLAWLDDDRIIGRRDHDVAVYDVRDQTRRTIMAFPDDLVVGVLIAPAVGVPATIR
jgi:hypothetical protein